MSFIRIEEIKDKKTGEITKIRIKNQSKRTSLFRNEIYYKLAKYSLQFRHNGFFLASEESPAVIEDIRFDCEHGGLFLRGDDKSKDKITMKVPSKEWLEHMRETIYQYNKIFGPCKWCRRRLCNSCNWKF